MPIIETRDLGKTYPGSGGKRAILGRGGVAAWFRKREAKRPALSKVTLTIEPGEAIGIIGRNGSGKSTLLKLIAGVSAPTSGALEVRGRVASLLELGAGFHSMLTGRENVYLNAGLLGMRHAQVDACFDAIAAFSELGAAIDQTVDTYSSGMYVRLAFSVAIHTDPDIFLVDEVLSVGDESFQRKCRARILELKESGKTILFVSHDLGTVNTLCDRVILLDKGRIISRGNSQDTIDYYLRLSGEESGVRHLTRGDFEVLFNHGRLSLYLREREVTAPAGIKVQFYSLGSYHESTGARWTITQAEQSRLEAEGVFPRLPVTVYLRLEVREGSVDVAVSWENNRPLDVDYVALHCFFPTSYVRWSQDGASDDLPTITVEDRHWANIVPAKQGGCSGMLFPAEGGNLAPVQVTADPAESTSPLQVDNTDYMNQARLVHITEAIPQALRPLPPARRSLAHATIDLSHDLASARAQEEEARAARTVSGPGWSARFTRGAVILNAGGADLTVDRHVHVQLKVNGLWLLSHGLLWDTPTRDMDRLVVRGRTTRLPCELEWILHQKTSGLGMEVRLVVEAPLRVDEFNVSVELQRAYSAWRTSSETGSFPNHCPGEAWKHLNRDFSEGTWITASSATLPDFTLLAEAGLGSFHPTPIYIGDDASGHALQAIGSPGQIGCFDLIPGSHVLFLGRIAVGAVET